MCVCVCVCVCVCPAPPTGFPTAVILLPIGGCSLGLLRDARGWWWLSLKDVVTTHCVAMLPSEHLAAHASTGSSGAPTLWVPVLSYTTARSALPAASTRPALPAELAALKTAKAIGGRVRTLSLHHVKAVLRLLRNRAQHAPRALCVPREVATRDALEAFMVSQVDAGPGWEEGDEQAPALQPWTPDYLREFIR